MAWNLSGFAFIKEPESNKTQNELWKIIKSGWKINDTLKKTRTLNEKRYLGDCPMNEHYYQVCLYTVEMFYLISYVLRMDTSPISFAWCAISLYVFRCTPITTHLAV
jgi:hypothetical protein